ncbi:MAG: DNA repair protein RecN [Armatimonadetes bacterium]|nr:DNA repair protein RecN [Armatimonadota bacterium]
MIVELHVENLAIIQEAKVAFRDGFTALTGETGAGKSLLIDALELCLGERADAELVRTGATKASVQLVVDLSTRPEILAIAEELGVDVEEGQVYIQREVMAEGRSQARVNGKSVPLSVLRELGAAIVDLHGQHQHQALLDQETHVQYLDSWIGGPATNLKAETAERYSAWQEAKRKYEALQKGIQEREQRLDMLRFQVNEIESFSPVEGEEADLNARLSRLRNVEKISDAAQRSLVALSEGEVNARDLLAAGLKDAEEVTRLDPSLDLAELQEALVDVQEAIHKLQAYMDTLDSDPEALEETIERLDGLKRLKRKYGETEAEILAYLESAQAELNDLTDIEASEDALRQALDASSARLKESFAELTALRSSRSKEFVADVQNHLADLSMAKTQFAVQIRPGEPSPDGTDFVEFLFSANAGEDLKPLAKIASGGEISRVMLAMKSALAGRAGVPTLIFDEVDTGLGGAAAAAVGKKIRALSEHYQVLAISHLPQVASRANEQFRIQKAEAGGRVQTEIIRLSEDDRVQEIARMLAGDEVSEHAVANARDLLRLL